MGSSTEKTRITKENETMVNPIEKIRYRGVRVEGSVWLKRSVRGQVGSSKEPLVPWGVLPEFQPSFRKTGFGKKFVKKPAVSSYLSARVSRTRN